MIEEQLKKYEEEIKSNPFFLARTLKTKIISKYHGQKVFFMKICESLFNHVQTMSATYKMLNAFQSSAMQDFLYQDTEKMQGKQYKQFIEFRKMMEEIENNLAEANAHNITIAEELFGIYCMTSMNATDTEKFANSIKNFEDFLEECGLEGISINPDNLPKKPMEYLIRIAEHLLQHGEENFQTEEWENEIGIEFMNCIIKYRNEQRKQVELKQIARRKISHEK